MMMDEHGINAAAYQNAQNITKTIEFLFKRKREIENELRLISLILGILERNYNKKEV